MNYKRIAVVGASTAGGTGDSEFGGFAGRLRKWHESQGTAGNNKYFYNLGISGNDSNDILSRVEKELKDRKVECVIFQLGGNDCRRFDSRDGDITTPLDEYKENIHDILTKTSEIADAIVISPYPVDEKRTCPVSWKPHYYRNDDLEKYSKALRRICERMDIKYINVWEYFKSKEFGEYLYEDGLHLGPAGHEYLFNRIIKDI
ncbi:hypothetical protein JW978_04495 [Candidatus Dojkabacteria bacterium]|nr:hypothetical protein [Candidatus Dojkabacteria bacterium]